MGFAGGRYFFVLGLSGALVQSCGGETGPIGGDAGSGGSSSSGAVSGNGGAPATGGSKAGSGGISSGGVVGGGGKATGGTIGTGGKATGGAVGTGGKSTGGTTGTGGKATGGTTDAGGPSCAIERADNDCLSCVKKRCCQEWLACGDDASCSQKPNGVPGEMVCIQDCIIDAVSQSGFVDLQACAAACAEDSSGLSPATSELVACIRYDGEDGLQWCSSVCFGTELP
jgi:hypothetical protein